MRRLAAVVAIALGGFVAALVNFSGEAPQACVADAPEDPAYTVAFAEPVQLGDRTHAIEVSRRGEPVTGARVCLNAELADQPGTQVSAQADEIEPGRFELPVDFPRPGEWQGTVLIGNEATSFEASTSVSFEVTS